MTTTTRVFGAELVGVQGKLVPILIFTPANGPETQITGLSENAAKELRIRLRSVLHCLEIDPGQRIGISVPAPATEGGAHGLDLPILIGVLAHLGKIPNPTTSVGPALEQVVSFGGLGLSGNIQAVRGAFARIHNVPLGPAIKALWIIPRANAREAWSEVPTGARFLDVASVQDLVTALRREVSETGEHGFAFPPPPPFDDFAAPDGFSLDLLAPQAFRVIQIAAATGLGLLLPSRVAGANFASGLQIARRIGHLLPRMTVHNMVEVTSIYSAGMSVEAGAVTQRPFRAPHHTVSDQGLCGSISRRGTHPGEASLAHHGVLLLDCLAEFRRPGLEQMFGTIREGVQRGLCEGYFPARPANIVGTLEPESRGTPGALLTIGDTDKRRVAQFQQHFPLLLRSLPTGNLPNHNTVPEARAEVAWAWAKRGAMAPMPMTASDTQTFVARAIANMEGSMGVLTEHRDEAEAVLRPARDFFAT